MPNDIYDGMTTEAFLQVQAHARKGKRHQNSRKMIIDNISFDSQAEAGRYQELKILQRAGDIERLNVHPEFIIQKRCTRWNKTVRKRTYTADFVYWDVATARWIVEDVKGYRISKKTGKRLPVVNETFYLRFDLARVAYPEYDFRIVLR